jgi:hypothetical protein
MKPKKKQNLITLCLSTSGEGDVRRQAIGAGSCALAEAVGRSYPSRGDAVASSKREVVGFKEPPSPSGNAWCRPE